MGFDIIKALGLGKKGASYDTYTTPPSPDYTALIGKLQGIGNVGFPEMEQWGQNYYNQQLMPNIRESYEAKRNPYGGSFADTPEFMQLAKGAQGVTSDVAQANLNARMQALQMLSGLVNKPQQMTTYQQAYNPVQDLLSGSLGLGSTLLGNYIGGNMQTNALKDVFGNSGISDMGNYYKDYYNTSKNNEYSQATAQPDWMQYAKLGAELLPMFL